MLASCRTAISMLDMNVDAITWNGSSYGQRSW